ncbi:MBOAT family O-acyltransferase [Flammeovirgaceae bacterium SG7u.111]|nr:MBOAT family O-acyltransferase [Flammeovirgaceae bacterium SG7u.132]WPO34019.1 MBOAT family O-acyltransferase [Flammeovirgaceae bacterium SG7u.111]
MLFNSLDFAIFLPVVFLLYWLVTNKNLRLQNLLIVVASYVFYGWWDWRFLSLIFFSSVVDYSVGLALHKQKNEHFRRILLWTSITVNLGFLGFFKYYNFFLENVESAFSLMGTPIQGSSLHIILPVGISFYTFQTLSYTLDIYKKKLSPTKDFISFLAFVSFFPQLVAGPIERASHLLPQFYKKREFEYAKAVDGLRQVLWGLFKKMVIADNAAELANLIFNNSSSYSGSTLMLGAVFFAFQIYGDFSGYSDIAIGTSRLFGFDLMQNFAFPYFSRDIAEFWRRWHISLSTWFRDYLYIPLGGSRGNILKKVRNTFVVFIVSGFWHGANWTYIVWGTLNAIYFLPLLLFNINRKNTDVVAEGKIFPTIREFAGILATFLLSTLAWIFFRAENIDHATKYIATIFSKSSLIAPNFIGMRHALVTLALIFLFCIIEWTGRENKFALEKIGLKWSTPARWVFYLIIAFFIFYFQGDQQEFIYFQF